MMEHSPLPWHVYDEGLYPGIDAANGASIVVFGEKDEACGVRGWTAADARENAEFICRAVNAHAELVAVLREIVEALRVDAPGTPLNHHKYDALGARAYAVLATIAGK